MIMAGEVLVFEQVSDKPGKLIAEDATVRIRNSLKYVSRGGLKLERALTEFDVEVNGKTVVDIGASTGGFTDCLLSNGARQVFAVDVGYGQLAWKLRSDPRVVTIERTNVRHLQNLPGEPVPLADLATIDVSFISLQLVLPAAQRFLHNDAAIIALIKPQFEAGKESVGKGGVVRSPKVHRQVLKSILDFAQQGDLMPINLTVSPILGPAGNVEFLGYFRRKDYHLDVTQKGLGQELEDADTAHAKPLFNSEQLIESALREAQLLRKKN